jgi:hypothetical protein
MIMIRRLRFFAATPTRGTSIDARFGVNPAGRTILSSSCLRCGVTVAIKGLRMRDRVGQQPALRSPTPRLR